MARDERVECFEKDRYNIFETRVVVVSRMTKNTKAIMNKE